MQRLGVPRPALQQRLVGCECLRELAVTVQLECALEGDARIGRHACCGRWARNHRTCNAAAMNSTAVTTCKAAASAFGNRDARRGKRVVVSVTPGIRWNGKVL